VVEERAKDASGFAAVVAYSSFYPAAVFYGAIGL
jgi:hypothetical protein